MHIVYILQSETIGRFYIGSTENLKLRIERHNQGWTKSTKNRGPWVVRWQEAHPDKSFALRRERELKSWKNRKLIEKLITASAGDQ